MNIRLNMNKFSQIKQLDIIDDLTRFKFNIESIDIEKNILYIRNCNFINFRRYFKTFHNIPYNYWKFN